MKDHPYAAIFPLIEGTAFDALVADIKANGLNEPIVLLDGMVLDGRNRRRACLAAGVKPRFIDWDPSRGDPRAWVLSTNAARRHLNPHQRAIIAARLDADPAALAVSKGLVSRAKELIATNPAKADEVFAGKAPLPVPPRAKHVPGTVPTNHEVKSVSILTDADGNMKGEWTKTAVAADDPPAQEITPPGFTVNRTSTMLDREGKALIQWVSSDRNKADEWDAMLKACREATEEYKGLAAPVPAPVVPGNLLNVIPIGDPHIGMYAWSKECGDAFDTDIAKQDLIAVIDALLERAPPAKTCLIAQLGDFFHAEDDQARTPRGNNALDVDTRSGRVTKIGYMIMRRVIDAALAKHERVQVINLRGNHDPHKSMALNLYLQGVYENDPRVEVLDNYDPYQFVTHGDCLLGFHHGDGAKPEQLPGIMASWREGAPWGKAKHRRWFTGHVHSFNGKDFAGCTWESFRTLAPGDFWAWWKGYRSEQSLDCLTFDEVDGLVSRQTVTLRLARKAGGQNG